MCKDTNCSIMLHLIVGVFDCHTAVSSLITYLLVVLGHMTQRRTVISKAAVTISQSTADDRQFHRHRPRRLRRPVNCYCRIDFVLLVWVRWFFWFNCLLSHTGTANKGDNLPRRLFEPTHVLFRGENRNNWFDVIQRLTLTSVAIYLER